MPTTEKSCLSGFRTAGIPDLVTRLLDLRRPFGLHYCVQERGLRKWSIRRELRQPYHLLYVPDSDPLIGSVNGHPVRVEPGEILWVQPFTMIDFEIPPPARNISISICRFELADDRIVRLIQDFRIGHRPEGEAVLDDLLPGHEMGATVDQLFQRAVLARILCRSFVEAEVPGGESGLTVSLRRQLMAFMTRNITRRFDIHELAAHVGMQADYFSRRFRRSFGVAPKSFIMRLRIRHASGYLLASNDGIAEVAERFGYDDIFLFSRQFRQVMGQSPRVWRTRTGSH